MLIACSSQLLISCLCCRTAVEQSIITIFFFLPLFRWCRRMQFVSFKFQILKFVSEHETELHGSTVERGAWEAARIVYRSTFSMSNYVALEMLSSVLCVRWHFRRVATVPNASPKSAIYGNYANRITKWRTVNEYLLSSPSQTFIRLVHSFNRFE